MNEEMNNDDFQSELSQGSDDNELLTDDEKFYRPPGAPRSKKLMEEKEDQTKEDGEEKMNGIDIEE